MVQIVIGYWTLSNKKNIVCSIQHLKINKTDWSLFPLSTIEIEFEIKRLNCIDTEPHHNEKIKRNNPSHH